MRETGMTAISRAVSELLRAGLIERHYQGFLVDHENRGAQRHAVYTITPAVRAALHPHVRSEEHTSELQSLMRISDAVFCLKKKKRHKITEPHNGPHATSPRRT